MSTVKVVDIISRARTLLKDASSVRWTLSELQLWINDSYRDTVILRPDANTLVGEFVCAEGPRQRVTATFSNASRLIECVRNTATSSNKSRVRIASRASVDSMRPNWYAETPTVNIELFVFDPRTPTEFLVYPPASTAARLEVMYAQVPSPHTLTDAQLVNPATAEVIRIDDMFAGAMLDYVLYRAYSKDAEDTANANRATLHFQAFQNALGVKGQSEVASQPGVA